MGEGSPYPKGRNPLSTTNQEKDRRRFSYPKGRNSLSITNQGEDGRRLFLSQRKKSSLNNKPRGRREKVPFILKEEIPSQQQTKGKMGEGSPYPKGRNPLSTTNQGEDGRRFPLS